MTREEFKDLFGCRRLCLVGFPEEVHQTVEILEELGFKSRTTDRYAFRRGETFRGEIWATASGKNWRFQRPYSDISIQALPIGMCDLIDIVYGEQPDDDELTGGDLTEIL